MRDAGHDGGHDLADGSSLRRGAFPVGTILAICALAGGGAFLVAAVIETRPMPAENGLDPVIHARTSVSLSQQGRNALGTYTAVLRQLLDSVSTNGTSPHQPGSANPDGNSPGSQPPGPPGFRR